MTNQNLFEKYGIKEVADVTFYRIERKNEVYESQREISVSSILKGALTTQTVYPLVNGIGDEEGFEAYVFAEADLLENEEFHSDLGSTKDTHEYSYPEQVLMLFAKAQNLITSTGVRYKFAESETIFGDIAFSDEYAIAPNSSEKIVVVGLVGSMDSQNYVFEDVTAAINNLATKTYKAKAYDIEYKNYAELIVDDEMGYFNPNYLTTQMNKAEKTLVSGTKYNSTTGQNVLAKGVDIILAHAEQWTDKEDCKSVNDAIKALRKKKKSLDQGGSSTTGSIKKISGGYDITEDQELAGGTDKTGEYTYGDITPTVTSKYALKSVLEALSTISATSTSVIDELKVKANDTKSNRAIYVKVDNTNVSASAYIYLLTNINYKSIALDKSGIFKFTDRMGNEVYYQDTIFTGVKNLALVVIGNKGLIFKVDRFGTRKIDQIAWMINEKGYISDTQAKKIVENGLFHTTNITIADETFEATCVVSDLKVRKIEKIVNKYVPVLYLDTLKVSTIEQTAEQTSATGGKGNAQLIIWDYGKEITLNLQDALYSPASMSAMLGAYDGNDFTKGVKDTKRIDRTEKCTAERSFIVPAGNSKGVPSEGDLSAQAVYIDLNTMQPYQDGTPIAEGEVFLKWTRSVAYADNSIGKTIEISAEKFPGTYKVVGDTFARNKTTGEDQRFQFVIPQAKMTSEQTITLEAEGDPTIFDMNLKVLRPDDGVMVKFIQYDVIDNEEEKDGSTMVKGTENLNLLDNAEMFRTTESSVDTETFIGATEY